MYEVAQRAGVGQATLYRHFPDRISLIAAIVGEDVDAVAQSLDEGVDTPDGFAGLLSRMLQSVAEHYTLTLIRLGRSGEGGETRFDQLRSRVACLFQDSLASARNAGATRADLSVDDIFLIVDMVGGALQSVTDSDERRAKVDRMLALLLPGLGPDM